MSSLAEEIGVTRASISAYEKGKKSPSPEVMGDLCKCLSMPLEFFVKDSIQKINSNKPIFYRSHKASLKLARESAEAKKHFLSLIVDYLEEFINFPPVNIPKFDVPFDPVALSDLDIKNLARKTRQYWGLSQGPISDIVCLLENKGIIVGVFSFECTGLEALSQQIESQNIIVINSDKGTAVRHRFDAAHELGHIILHRNVSRETMEDKEVYDLMEEQAHAFSREFIFPSEAFLTEARRFTLNEFIKLKARWKMSIASQIKHAESLKVISTPQVRNLQRVVGRNGWRKFEPLDDELPHEKPRLIREAFEMLLKNGIQTADDIFDRLPIDFSELEDITGLTRGYLSSFSKTSSLTFKKRLNDRHENSAVKSEDTTSSKVIDFMEAFSRRK